MLPQLKSYTADLHQVLEQKLNKILFNPELTPEQYHKLLHNFLMLYIHLESQLCKLPEIGLLLKERSKIPWLLRDIDYMQGITNHIYDRKIEFDPITVNDCSKAYGVMYVIEGSTLGGKYISEALQKMPWISLENVNFFHSYGENRGIMWKKFIKVVDHYGHDNTDNIPIMLESARATFRLMDEGLFINLP